MRRTKEIFGDIDSITIVLYLLLVFFGWINIYASMYNDDISNSIIGINTKHGKQLIFIGLSIFIAFVILIIDWKFFNSFAYIFYGFSIILLILVLIFGSTAGGAKSWFEIGGFKIQPSEFAKFTTALAFSKILSSSKKTFLSFRSQVINYTIILIPTLLIFLQNDLGTSIIFASFILVFFREGLSGYVLLAVLGIALLGFLSIVIDPYILSITIIVIITSLYFRSSKRVRSLKVSSILLIISHSTILLSSSLYHGIKIPSWVPLLGNNTYGLPPHQVDRIDIFLGKTIDPLGSGYNLLQSKIAIGSGGLFGKGFLNGTQTRFDFVPEQSTDFIFCTIAEQWGFIGSLLFITIFTILLIRIISLAEKQKSKFCRVYGYSVACILFTHLVVNIGMTIGLMPVAGIPLPFISAGGSSLISFTILLFTFLNLNSYRRDILR